ncbi:MAG: 2-oxoglutarate dehydrogenase complex dihydrolipoyllysine-residue succinyltransferase [Planctomycetota bacterium]|nr:MAG: 2-oxoglutarate dehydrogenase complex dihydrolipoyllysine-residue succinyltransferase [Planctomycetota bacterium]
MPTDVRVPAMGESVTEGVLARWLVSEGEVVSVDQPIYELETDKITTEVPSPVGGAIHFQVAEGDTVEIDAVVASIDESVSAPDPSSGETSALEPAPNPEPSAKTTNSDGSPTTGRISAGDTAKLSPAAKQMVADKKLDAKAIEASGPKGHITKGDVLNHLDKAPSPAAPKAPASTSPAEEGAEQRRRMSPLRQRIAQRLVQAQRTAAMLTTFNEVDMSACMALRKKFKDQFQETHGVGLGFMSFFVKAVVSALKAYPDINSRIDGNEVVTPHDQHIGIAVGTEKGLVVPVLRKAQELSFADIEGAIRGYAKRARDGKLGIADMDGGTFTITNGGVYGSLMSTPILNPPQSGILGMHTIKERPVAVDGQVVIRPMMYIALSYDHRIVDGAGAVGFLVRIKDCIENPERLLLGL